MGILNIFSEIELDVIDFAFRNVKENIDLFPEEMKLTLQDPKKRTLE